MRWKSGDVQCRLWSLKTQTQFDWSFGLVCSSSSLHSTSPLSCTYTHTQHTVSKTMVPEFGFCLPVAQIIHSSYGTDIITGNSHLCKMHII